jgi:hypothetical protein
MEKDEINKVMKGNEINPEIKQKKYKEDKEKEKEKEKDKSDSRNSRSNLSYNNINENNENLFSDGSSIQSNSDSYKKKKSKSRSRSISRSRSPNIKRKYDNNKEENFIMRNGCCKDCMRAFSKNGKSCLCQVPKNERKIIMSENGCNICGCHGKKNKNKNKNKITLIINI